MAKKFDIHKWQAQQRMKEWLKEAEEFTPDLEDDDLKRSKIQQMMAKEKTERGYNFHYLFDADQSVAKAYTAACTPDFFLFDADHKLVYRGQLDDTRPTRIRSGVYDSSNGPTGVDLRNAIDAVLAGRQPTAEQKPSMGCNIKWSAGNEPDYYNL